MCPSNNEPFAMCHFIEWLFESTKILLDQTSMKHKLKLAIFNAPSTLGSICENIHPVSRLGISHVNVRCDWIIVGGNGIGSILIKCLHFVSDPLNALAPVGIRVKLAIIFKIR